MQISEPTLAPELEVLKRQLDDLVEARGWTPVGYYFDDSPYHGIHLVREKIFWKLYWISPGTGKAELRFASLQDAFQHMLAAVVIMKEQESAMSPVDATAPFSLEPDGPEQAEVPAEDVEEEDEEADPVDMVVVLLFFLLILVVAIAILAPFSPFLMALVSGT